MSEKLEAVMKRLLAQDGGTIGDIFELVEAVAKENGMDPIEFLKLLNIQETEGDEAFVAAVKKLRGTIQ